MTTRTHKIAAAIAIALGGFTVVIAEPAVAQQAPAQPSPQKLQTVVVTGSRIARPDMVSPTPVVVASPEQLQLSTVPNVGTALNNLPQFRNTNSPQMSGSNRGVGRTSVDLRGLGIDRTLVLLDRRRFNIDNDMNAVPSILIKSVDIVTGGASAAWGSGAVSGAVNIVLNHDLNGFRADLSAGQSSHDDDDKRAASLAWGTSFAGGRGHFIIGGQYVHSRGITPRTARERARWQLMQNGDGSATFRPDVRLADEAYGGLIVSGVLAGKTFNPDGSMRDFQYGSLISGESMSGGEGPPIFPISPLVAPVTHYAVLAAGRYDFTDSLSLKFQARTYRVWDTHPYFLDDNPGFGDPITISIDNAFLPDATRQAMMDAGETSIKIGRVNDDIPALPMQKYNKRTGQFMVGLDGSIDNVWQWSTYISHAERNLYTFQHTRLVLADNWNYAVDSILDPQTHQPICRIALMYPDTKCVPIDLFGHGAPSVAASNYVMGTGLMSQRTTLDVFSGSISGPLFDLPAGTTYLAAGVDWRRQGTQVHVGPQDAAKAFRKTNTEPMQGAFHVAEGFVELNAPLVADVPLMQNLSADLAARYSHYNLAGGVWTWKAALIDNLGAGFRARVGYSQDIRAPDLSELFTGVLPGWNPGRFDPVTGQTVTMESLSGGNPNLKPEKAHTLTAGLTWSPTGARGWNVSADYFRIKIEDVIQAPSDLAVINRCVNGSAEACARVHRDANNNLLFIDATFANLSTYEQDGVDIQVGYAAPITVFGQSGTLQVRNVATWVHQMTVTNNGVSTEYVGSQGDAFAFGVPRWRAVSSLQADVGRVSANVRARYLSPGSFNRTLDITNGRIGTYVYWDVGGSYRFAGTKLSVYAHINNLFDKKMPVGGLFSPYYDVVGRYYTIGLRYGFQ